MHPLRYFSIHLSLCKHFQFLDQTRNFDKVNEVLEDMLGCIRTDRFHPGILLYII